MNGKRWDLGSSNRAHGATATGGCSLLVKALVPISINTATNSEGLRFFATLSTWLRPVLERSEGMTLLSL